LSVALSRRQQFRGEVSTKNLARPLRTEVPTGRVGPLGASTEAMANKAPLGEWCPPSIGAHIVGFESLSDTRMVAATPVHMTACSFAALAVQTSAPFLEPRAVWHKDVATETRPSATTEDGRRRERTALDCSPSRRFLGVGSS
jgi:hypothetical protein